MTHIADMTGVISHWIGERKLREVEAATQIDNAYICQICSGKRPLTEKTAVRLLVGLYGVTASQAKMMYLMALRNAIKDRILLLDSLTNHHA